MYVMHGISNRKFLCILICYLPTAFLQCAHDSWGIYYVVVRPLLFSVDENSVFCVISQRVTTVST